MNELIAIENQQVGEGSIPTVNARDLIHNENALLVCGSFAVLMNQVAKMAYTNPVEARRLLGEMQAPLGLDYLKDAVFSHACWFVQCSVIKEKDVQAWFFNNLEQLIPGARQTVIAKNRSHLPDGFVMVDGETIPVEVKLESFTVASLRQLKRYMKTYGAKRGIAVARDLRCELPESVTFIQVPGEVFSK